jgi:outer membrane protein assembly factor BamB
MGENLTLDSRLREPLTMWFNRQLTDQWRPIVTKHSLLLAIAICSGPWTTPLPADDWPQWLGPRRDSVWREEGIVPAIPEGGLPVLWRTKISGGYAGPAVAGGKVFVTDYVRTAGEPTNDPGSRAELEGTERILCLSAEDGTVLWKYEYDCPYAISYPAGPRCTPTVDGDRVYTLGAEGHLFCFDVETGTVRWSKQFQEDYNAPVPIWGFAAHPLVDEDLLFCVVGGEGSVAVAFDKKTGEERWRALSASEQGYCPPTMITAAGRKQLLIWDADNLNGLNPRTGEVYWSIPLKPDYGMSITAPRQSGDLLFAGGIGNVAALIRLNQDTPDAEVVWRGDTRTAVYPANSTPIIDEGTLYGVDCRSGGLRAVDLETGERLWETFEPTTGTRRAGHATAFLVQHRERYFLFNETGHLISAELTREGYAETGRVHILEPTGEAFGRSVVWSHPAFAQRRCFARNDEEIVCVSLESGD